MNEVTLSEILEKICMDEAAAIPEVPVPELSFRHRRKMKRIFSMYEKKLRSPKEYRVGGIKRYIIVMVMIFLAMCTVAAGAAAIYGFMQNKHHDFTELLTANAENCPKTIENVYYLSEMPEGYELYIEENNEYRMHKSYYNYATNMYMIFTQTVKNRYKKNFNTEYREFEEFDIDGHYALYLETDNSEGIVNFLIWDNGDYVLQISGNFAKDEFVKLAKSAKI